MQGSQLQLPEGSRVPPAWQRGLYPAHEPHRGAMQQQCQRRGPMLHTCDYKPPTRLSQPSGVQSLDGNANLKGAGLSRAQAHGAPGKPSTSGGTPPTKALAAGGRTTHFCMVAS